MSTFFMTMAVWLLQFLFSMLRWCFFKQKNQTSAIRAWNRHSPFDCFSSVLFPSWTSDFPLPVRISSASLSSTAASSAASSRPPTSTGLASALTCCSGQFALTVRSHRCWASARMESRCGRSSTARHRCRSSTMSSNALIRASRSTWCATYHCRRSKVLGWTCPTFQWSLHRRCADLVENARPYSSPLMRRRRQFGCRWSIATVQVMCRFKKRHLWPNLSRNIRCYNQKYTQAMYSDLPTWVQDSCWLVVHDQSR